MPDSLKVYDDLVLGRTVRRDRALDRDEAERQRRDVERHLANLGIRPGRTRQATYSTIPPDGPNMYDTAGVDVLTAACEQAPTCPRCQARATPWQPPNGRTRYACLACGYDPDRPEAGE